MHSKDFLKSILTDKQIKELNTGLKSDKVIIIKGKQGPTGKTTLKRLLNRMGYKAYEEHEIVELKLDKIQQDLNYNLLSEIED